MMKNVKKNGLIGKKVDLEENWGFEKESFDVGWASHIIEHMTNPLLSLNRARIVLKDKGILIATIPVVTKNWIYTKIHRRGKGQSWKSRIHTYAFTKDTFKFLMNVAGFRIIETGFFATKRRILNKLLSPLLCRYLGQRTFVGVKDEKIALPRISVPERYKDVIRHHDNYVKIKNEEN